MPEQVFVIVRDARGSLVHVRRRDDGECVGCIETGLYEIVRSIIESGEDCNRETRASRTALPRRTPTTTKPRAERHQARGPSAPAGVTKR